MQKPATAGEGGRASTAKAVAKPGAASQGDWFRQFRFDNLGFYLTIVPWCDLFSICF